MVSYKVNKERILIYNVLDKRDDIVWIVLQQSVLISLLYWLSVAMKTMYQNKFIPIRLS